MEYISHYLKRGPHFEMSLRFEKKYLLLTYGAESFSQRNVGNRLNSINWLIEFKVYLRLLEICITVLQGFFALRTQNPDLVLFTVFEKWASPPLLLSLSCQSITLSQRKVPEKIVKYLFSGDKDQCVGQALETATNGPE